jgi:hypothetical protein
MTGGRRSTRLQREDAGGEAEVAPGGSHEMSLDQQPPSVGATPHPHPHRSAEGEMGQMMEVQQRGKPSTTSTLTPSADDGWAASRAQVVKTEVRVGRPALSHGTRIARYRRIAPAPLPQCLTFSLQVQRSNANVTSHGLRLTSISHL